MNLSNIIDLERYPLDHAGFLAGSYTTLQDSGVLVLPGFLRPEAIQSIREEGQKNQHFAFYTQSQHNVYLSPEDPDYPVDHPRNRQVRSSKGCITTDQIPARSALRELYASALFREFLCHVLDEKQLYEYADPLSSINLHYAAKGQELGWHFDNSSFAITLMIQSAERGGAFEYVRNVRNADSGDMSFQRVEQILEGKEQVSQLSMAAGTLVLFRGRDSLHRVTPVECDSTRMLVVLAYNSAPDIALSESARMTFYGRLG